MARHVSGVFVRTDRVVVAPNTLVRFYGADHKQSSRALLLELSATTLRLSAVRPPAPGSNVFVAITLPGRYLEFEVPGAVQWTQGADFVVQLDYLSARQAYGLSLARDVLREAPAARSLSAAVALRGTAASRR
jgi:hypothetical protein